MPMPIQPPVLPEMIDETQDADPETQQATQQASQQANAVDGHLWGYLQPCSSVLRRIDFWKLQATYRLGRNTEANEIIMPGFKVSNTHCTITWDGKEDSSSCVTVQDLSSNGTFINGSKIGKGSTRILREGNEIAFGTCVPQPQGNGIEDYRFVYRHTAAGPPTEGFYACYDISHELGKGSFATVMKAVSRKTGEWFAVKMIQDSRMTRNTNDPAGNNANAARSTAFAREISILEKLKHPNICELKEVFFQDNGDINLVLELVEGGDLLEYILSRGGLAEPDAQHITYQICDAMAYIHDQGVTHRDLKPENVLLTADVPPKVKVADFGLAKVVDSLTMLRTMCGTPSYLAPEVVRQENREGYDNLVDSWSVGVIVFSMLTNSSPFIEDENQRDIRTRIAERHIDWDTLHQVGVSDEARSFVERLLEYDPLRRMTLAAALQHPWLQAYTPVYDNSSFRKDSASSTSSIPADVSMMSADVSDGIELLHLSQDGVLPTSQDSAAAMVSAIPGAFPRNNGLRREASRTAPLQRRSQVISAAAEGNGAPLSEPSWEMVNAAASLDGGWAGNNKGVKRVHSELTPLSEEGEEDVRMADVRVAAAAAAGARKKGKGEGEEAAKGRGGKGARGKGRGAGATTPGKPRTRAAVAERDDEMSEDEVPTRPRRSTRQTAPTPQKVSRRS